MNKIIYYLFAVFLILFLLQNCKINKLKPEKKSSSLINNILVVYGEEIYLRESCGQCHTQKIGKENKQQFSLDGLGDKYTNDWLFQYLSDPRSMNPYSTMPSYPHIISNKLNKKTLKSILKERYSNNDFHLKKNWKELKIQLDANVKNYKDKPFLAKNKSEIVALIAYLQSIPSSKKLIVLENKKYANIEKEKSVWNDMLADDQSILVHTPITKNNLEAGKILFSKYCSTCHREKDRSIASSFKNYTWKHGSTNKDIANSIVNGIPGKAMAAWWRMLTPEEVGKLVIYISTLSDE